MTFEQILSLSLLQGLTEFLPISSSAHLVLLPKLVDWETQDLAFDVAVHVGSLLAVLWYFRRDLIQMARAAYAHVAKKTPSEDSRLVGFVCIATIPVCLTGLPLGSFDDWLRESAVRTFATIAATTLGFGILLGVADRRRGEGRSEKKLRLRDAIWIGLAQAIAPIPGTSRSGITVTAALFLGLSRRAAARFSFLLSIPTIALAGGFLTLKLIRDENPVDWGSLGLGVLFSAVSAYLSIHYFLKLIERIGMMPFVIYRVVLAIVLVVFCIRAATA